MKKKSPICAALGKAAGAAAVCVCLSVPHAAMAQPRSVAGHPAKAKKQAPLSQQERVLHALNRFTFGPRPGDEAAVRRIGLDEWFEQQMHPERIPDTGLEARLAAFPAMQLTQDQLIERFPPPQVLRQYIRGADPAPADAAERAIYDDAAFEYQEKRTKAASAAGSAVSVMPRAGQAGGVMAGSNMDAGPAAAGTGSLQAGDAVNAPALIALAPDERMQRLFAMSPEEMQELRSGLRGREQPIYEGLSAVQREQAAEMLQAPVRVVGAEVMSQRLLRDVYSERQLQAVMADFWLNHFNVYLRKDQNEPYLLPAYEREAILPHALGRFEDLLVATAESPAMLVYLDNWTSIGPNSVAAERVKNAQAANGKVGARLPKGINENYARELMELHTLGVNGGYTQQDVIEVAKCFTGWTVKPAAQGGGFTFNENRHEPGPKTVLGHVIPEGGQSEGLAVLHLLATSPATAHFVSQKLAVRFVSDDPPKVLVNRMTAAYLKSDGDIATVLETMFRSKEFWSPQVYRAKVKTPVEFVVSALRASGADVTNPLPVTQALDRLGMPLYGMQTPNGYSWTADAWTSSSELLNRMNFALVLSGNRVPGTHVNWAAQPGVADQAAADDAVHEARLEAVLLGEQAAGQTRAAVLHEAQNPEAINTAQQNFRSVNVVRPATPVEPAMTRVVASRAPAQGPASTPVATMAGLLLGSPDFQRR